MPERSEVKMNGLVLWWPIGWLFVLAASAILFGALGKHLPSYLSHPLGRMPLSVVWFGALGGIMASLHGIFLHNHDWKTQYNYWHYLSAPVGAAMGVVGYLILLATVKSATGVGASVDSAIFPLAAFILGYTQRNFQTLLDKATGVIFGAGKSENESIREQRKITS